MDPEDKNDKTLAESLDKIGILSGKTIGLFDIRFFLAMTNEILFL